MEPTFIEMFCGIGGFRLGLERSGWRCVWANDIDKHACQIYRKHFGDRELVEGDIRTIDPSTIPDHTLLTAGFPCQSFSVAGKRKGFEDTRGTLFYHIARVACAKRPPLLLLENVKGLLSNDGGRTFARILQTLDELGYDVEWQVLNSKYFGVPQNRERVFIIGHLRGTCSRQVFPIGQAGAEADGARKKTPGNRCSEDLIRVYDGHKRRFTDEMGTLTGRENRRGGNWLIVAVRTRNYANLESPKTIANALTSVQKDNLVLDAETIRIRRLTPVECERLQGFPDGWTEGVPETHRYRLLGNAVTVSVVECLGARLLGCLQ